MVADISLLQACKNEFHRRLARFNEWKEANAAQTNAQRAPQSVINSAKQSQVSIIRKGQRCRRISRRQESKAEHIGVGGASSVPSQEPRLGPLGT